MQPKHLTFPLLAVLLALLAVPTVTHASWAGPCPAPAGSPSYWVEACAEEQKAVETKQKEVEKEAAAKAHAEANPPCSVEQWYLLPELCTTEAAEAVAAPEREAAAKAHAEANPPCSVREWSIEPELCTTEAAEAVAAAAKAAAKAAAEAAKKAEEQAPATLLDVKVRSEHGDSYADPGWTYITIKSTPYVPITFTGDHGMGASHFRLFPGTEGIVFRQLPGHKIEANGNGTAVAGAANIEVEWSCHRRDQTIHFTVQAQGGSGPPLVRTGHFKIAVSGRWCAAAKRREGREDARQRAERHAEERKEAAERAEKHRHEVERYETNCRAIGGIPVEISTSEGNRIVCHSKTGGVIPVPD
jgi:chemotaxis protein histidine kinase CheA